MAAIFSSTATGLRPTDGAAAARGYTCRDRLAGPPLRTAIVAGCGDLGGSTRHLLAIAQVLLASVLIHITGGRVEARRTPVGVELGSLTRHSDGPLQVNVGQFWITIALSPVGRFLTDGEKAKPLKYGDIASLSDGVQ